MSDQSAAAVRRGHATSGLRQWGYAAVLVAMAFSQSGGRMVADTKFDLVTHPLRFLGRALHLWDPIAAFGQVQNQAYGYFWPMGPFFALGDLAHLPEWAVQRLWWSLLLCLAFFGILRVAQRLRIGSPLTQVVAAFAYVLTPRITTLLGGTSVEVWPMALAPWVLLPLVAGSERGSVRRAAALSALVVASCGGVNAVAVAAVLPLGVIWILTRARGPRRWRLLGWWTGLTVLATAWWSGPLLLLGRYSAPFLDYIENATITTVPTDLTRTLVGVSDWVAYFAGFDYPAGRELVSTPFMLFDAAVVVALGLVGLGLRSVPHQRFLVVGVLVGAALVGLGYAGDLHGFFAADRQHALDGALAPLRNLHKFDVVLRIPLVLGFAHALVEMPRLLRGRGSLLANRLARLAVVLVMVAVALPWLRDDLAPSGGVEAVPTYWRETAAHLDDGTGGVALVVPGATFGIYTWGNVHDDVMQGLATSPWAVRNVIPLAQPGNVVMLDRVTRLLESGRPSDRLAPFLAANGITRLVVRNDLDRFNTAAPDPAYLRSVLANSAGLHLEKGFGPEIGDPPVVTAKGTRVINGNGLAARVSSVEVWAVDDAHQATLVSGPQELVGGPGTGADLGLADHRSAPRLLAADVSGSTLPLVSGQVLTDGMRRRETNFSAVRWNVSSTTPRYAPYRLRGPEHSYRVVRDLDRWSTALTWVGAASVEASSSEAYADALPPLSIGEHPGAALDRYRRTAWRSARQLDPVGQWWQVDFGDRRAVDRLTVRFARDSAPVRALRISLGGRSVRVPAPRPGGYRSYRLDLPVGRVLRITAAGRPLELPGSLAISEVRIPDFSPVRTLQLPAPDRRLPVDTVSLSRDPDRMGCVLLAAVMPCLNSLAASGEDGDVLARSFAVTSSEDYALTVQGSARRGHRAAAALGRLLGVRVSSPDTLGHDLASLPVAMVDGDPATTWIARRDLPTFRVALEEPRRIEGLRITLNPDAAASRPTELVVRDLSSRRRAVVQLDADGRGRLPGWRTDRLQITVRSVDRAFRIEGDRFAEAGVGVSELRLLGSDGEVGGAPGGVVRTRCGRGPRVEINGRLLRTSVAARVRALMRGDPVPVHVCGANTVSLQPSGAFVVARPTALFRADAVTFDRTAVSRDHEMAVRPVDLHRDSFGSPTAIDLPPRDRPGILALPQNINAGWRATLDGRALPVQRVEGWQQGWRVPSGSAAQVRLEYTPGTAYLGMLLAGLVLLLVVALSALPISWPFRRGEELPPLAAGRPGLLDGAVVLVAGGLLCGWWSLLVVPVVALALWRRPPDVWGPSAGVAMVLAGIGLTWPPIVDRTWALGWTQAWALVALLALSGALMAGRRAHPDRFPRAGVMRHRPRRA